jgi:subtilisin family serine protease
MVKGDRSVRLVFPIILGIILACTTISALPYLDEGNYAASSSDIIYHGLSIYDGKLNNSSHSWAGYGKTNTCGDGPFYLRFKLEHLEGGLQVNTNMIQHRRYAIGFINDGNNILYVYILKELEDESKTLLVENNLTNYNPTREYEVQIDYNKGRFYVTVHKAAQDVVLPEAVFLPIIDYYDPNPLPPGRIDFESLEGSSANLSEVVTSCSSSAEEQNYIGVAHFKEPDLSYLINATSALDSPFFVSWGEVPANQIMVMINGSLGFREARELAEQLASELGTKTGQEANVVGELEYINLFQIETESRSLQELVRDISFVSNFNASIVAVFPNEQIYPENSHLLNPNYSGDNGEGYRIVGVQEAWNLIKDSNVELSKVNVGVADDGIYLKDGQFTDADINTSIKIYPMLMSPPSELASRGFAGSHGTGVTNLLAANGRGLQGIASNLPKDKLKIFMINISGKGKSFVTSSMLAFQFEIQNGSSIISCSMGKTDNIAPGAPVMYDEFFNKTSKDPRFEKVLFIFSAGNDGKEVKGKKRIPNGLPVSKSLPNVITVGNIMNDGEMANGQTVGTGQGAWKASTCSQVGEEYDITLAAPGEQALWGLNIARGNTNIINEGGGTSMAAPQVTAAAILIRSIDPCLTAGQIKDRLIETAALGPAKLGGKILAIDKAVNETIHHRTIDFCSQFRPGDEIDLPGNFNTFDKIYGSTETKKTEVPPQDDVGFVEGRVYDIDTNIGVALVEMTVDYKPTGIMTDAFGNYRLIVSAPSSHLIGIVRSSEYGGHPRTIMVSRNRTITFNLGIKKGQIL